MFDTLSETQRRVVFEKEGKFVVRACPGSGKTYSVAARLSDRMSKWPLNCQGIAVKSFTNAAWQEIERQVTNHFNIAKPIPYPPHRYAFLTMSALWWTFYIWRSWGKKV
jgi:DNA helicase-2/ATP-dependent DNA helicase PcrA